MDDATTSQPLDPAMLQTRTQFIGPSVPDRILPSLSGFARPMVKDPLMRPAPGWQFCAGKRALNDPVELYIV